MNTIKTKFLNYLFCMSFKIDIFVILLASLNLSLEYIQIIRIYTTSCIYKKKTSNAKNYYNIMLTTGYKLPVNQDVEQYSHP